MSKDIRTVEGVKERHRLVTSHVKGAYTSVDHWRDVLAELDIPFLLTELEQAQALNTRLIEAGRAAQTFISAVGEQKTYLPRPAYEAFFALCGALTPVLDVLIADAEATGAGEVGE